MASQSWYFAIDKYLAEKGITKDQYNRHHDAEEQEGRVFSEIGGDEALLYYEIMIDAENSELSLMFYEKLKLSFPKLEQRAEDFSSVSFGFRGNSAVVSCCNLPHPFREYFPNYDPAENYPAGGELVQKILDYFVEQFNRERAAKISVKDAPKVGEEDHLSKFFPPKADKERGNKISPDFLRLEAKVNLLLSIAQEHPLTLRGEDAHLKQLYVQAINEDIGNLQLFEFEEQRIPYVLVNSDDIWGNVGKPFLNLYFVAKDKAPERWQQQIVAYHESLCVKIGHDNAEKEEAKLVQHLGKEKEYVAWRKEVICASQEE